MKLIRLAAIAALSVAAAQVNAATVSKVVMKVGDDTTKVGTVIDPHLDWVNSIGINEGSALGASTSDTTTDYKDSWVDTNWSMVDSVRVSMFTQGTEVAFIEFDATGTTKLDFFQSANVTSSSWSSIGGGNFFSIAGDSVIERHWFVENNYGGCGIDRGWMVVLENRSGPCAWDNNNRAALGSATRGFAYSTLASHGNWNNPGEFGIADVFAVTVSYDDGAPAIPVPASALLLGTAFAGFGMLRRRKSEKQV